MQQNITIQVDKSKTLGKLPHSWRYIGYDECNYTYIPEGRALLEQFGKLEPAPYYVRTHFMFNNGNCHGSYKYGSTNLYTEDENGTPHYNFEIYDRVVDTILQTGNKPFLELGFMPMDLADTAYLPATNSPFAKFSQYKDKGWSCPPKDYDKWHALIETLARHLLEKYGADELKTWYFELWNEPDISYWCGTAAEYCKLFDYTEHALHGVLPEAYFGGPGVTDVIPGNNSHHYLETFLGHCKTGVNFCTGQPGTRLDFITYHAKGGGFPFSLFAQKQVPSVANLVRYVKAGLDTIVQFGYQNLEVVLSEADPDGWAAGGYYDNTNMIYRNTEFYASYTASAYHKIHQLSKEYGIPIRPLAWAFFFPGERCFEGTRTFATQGINKAIFNLFALYGHLGDEELAFSSSGALSLDKAEPYAIPRENIARFVGDTASTDIGGFAAKGPNGETQIFLYSHQYDRDINENNQITLEISGYGDNKGLLLTHYQIDPEHSNAYAEYLRQGSPEYPTSAQYQAIKAADKLACLAENQPLASVDGQITLQLELPSRSIALLVIHQA